MTNLRFNSDQNKTFFIPSATVQSMILPRPLRAYTAKVFPTPLRAHILQSWLPPQITGG